MKKMVLILLSFVLTVSCITTNSNNSNSNIKNSNNSEASQLQYDVEFFVGQGWTEDTVRAGLPESVEYLLFKNGTTIEDSEVALTIAHRLLPAGVTLEQFATYQQTQMFRAYQNANCRYTHDRWDAYGTTTPSGTFDQYLSARTIIVDDQGQETFQKLIYIRVESDIFLIAFVSRNINELDDEKLKLIIGTLVFSRKS